MLNTYEIQVTFNQSQNYTPTDAIRKWAKSNAKNVFTDNYFRTVLQHTGQNWYYDHWNIEKHSDGTETVTLYLKAP